MTTLLLGLGLVAVIEGLVLALAPLRFEDIVKALAEMTIAQRRTLGLVVMAVGVALIYLSRYVF